MNYNMIGKSMMSEHRHESEREQAAWLSGRTSQAEDAEKKQSMMSRKCSKFMEMFLWVVQGLWNVPPKKQLMIMKADALETQENMVLKNSVTWKKWTDMI